jgi:hypothetical protein
MVNLDNYIYYSICEKSFDFYKYSHFSTYRNFCNIIRLEAKYNSLTNSNIILFNEISKYLYDIYNLDRATSLKYIVDFFDEEKYIVFYEPVKLVASIYKNSFN